jgi:hypothetical protein
MFEKLNEYLIRTKHGKAPGEYDTNRELYKYISKKC